MKLVKFAFLIFFLSFVQSLFADGNALFKKKCGVCHTLSSVSKGKMGPDLTGIASKRPLEYVKLYMQNPKDAKAKFPDIFNKEVKGKYNSVMPKVNITDDEVSAILDVLK